MNIVGSSKITSGALGFIALAAILTACPPPQSNPLDPTAPVFESYSAILVNQVGTSVTGTANGTLGKTSLEISGNILNAASSDTFSAKLTCIKTQDLNIGIENGHATIYGSLAEITNEERTILNNNACIISVSKQDGTVILNGSLKH